MSTDESIITSFHPWLKRYYELAYSVNTLCVYAGLWTGTSPRLNTHLIAHHGTGAINTTTSGYCRPTKKAYPEVGWGIKQPSVALRWPRVRYPELLINAVKVKTE